MTEIQLSKPLQAVILAPFFLLIISGLIVPSDGSHGLLNIKSLSFIGTVLGALCCAFFTVKLHREPFKLLSFLFSTLLFLCGWFLVAMFNDDFLPSSSIDQLKIFILTVSVVVVSSYYVAEQLVSFKTLLKTILITNFVYSALKITLVALHLVGIINLWEVLESLGIRFMSMDIFGIIPRMQTSVDIATPFLLFFFLQASHFDIKWRRGFKMIFILITLIAIFLSFSRYLLAAAFLSLFLHLMTLRLRTIVAAALLSLLAAATVIALVGPDIIYPIIERRFASKEANLSDEIRVIQINALMEDFFKHPLLGKGLGGYTKENFRDTLILHSYEVQWVAFLMQFGIFGLFILLLGISTLIYTILFPPMSREKIALFFLFLFWLFSGFTNPFLISLTSGIIYSVFYLTAKELKATAWNVT